MIWEYFIYFAIAAILFWSIGAYCAWKRQQRGAYFFTTIGLTIFFAYILLMWHTLERPPMRTMGETRLWYSFFLPLAGIIVYARSRYHWILSFSTLLSSVFIGINLLKPEIHTKAMMPALQSPWFASPCHRLHVCLRPLWRRHPHGLISVVEDARQRLHDSYSGNSYGNPHHPRQHRQHGRHGLGLSHHRYALRCTMGQRCLGRLLGLGSQGDLGGHHLVSLFALYAPAPHVTR